MPGRRSNPQPDPVHPKGRSPLRRLRLPAGFLRRDAARGSTVLENTPEGQAAGEIEAVVNELLAARAPEFAA
jgi:hypothetical protein